MALKAGPESSSSKRPCRNKEASLVEAKVHTLSYSICESIRLMKFVPILLQPKTLLMRLIHVKLRSRHYTRQKLTKFWSSLLPGPPGIFIHSKWWD